jgi:hypothetical protein
MHHGKKPSKKFEMDSRGHHHKAQSDLKVQKSNGKIATSDAENAHMMSTHFDFFSITIER